MRAGPKISKISLKLMKIQKMHCLENIKMKSQNLESN
jgi:hypothetical protein